MLFIRARQHFLAFCALVLSAIAPAYASQLDIQPLSLSLTGTAPSGALTIENQSPYPVRLQIKGFAWNQVGDDELKLTPTDDLIVFPSLMTIDPGQRRSIRIGSTLSANLTEKNYRVQIVELSETPQSQNTAQAMSVQLHPHITLPVFIPPVPLEGKTPEAHEAIAHRNTVLVAVENPGNVHDLVRNVHIIAKGSAEDTIFDGSTKGWYILPGLTRVYAVKTPENICARIKSLAIDVDTESGISHNVVIPQSACAK